MARTKQTSRKPPKQLEAERKREEAARAARKQKQEQKKAKPSKKPKKAKEAEKKEVIFILFSLYAKFRRDLKIMVFFALDFPENYAAKVFFGCFDAPNFLRILSVFCLFLVEY